MMRLGMLIDIQHMGERTADEALALAEANHYPVMTSHTQVRELAFGYQSSVGWDPRPLDAVAAYGTSQVERLAGEQMQSREQIERIRRLGGMVGIELESANVAGRWGRDGRGFLRRHLRHVGPRIPLRGRPARRARARNRLGCQRSARLSRATLRAERVPGRAR